MCLKSTSSNKSLNISNYYRLTKQAKDVQRNNETENRWKGYAESAVSTENWYAPELLTGTQST